MGDHDDLEARLAGLERELANERAASELEALETLRREERELGELEARLATLLREHREAVAEVLGDDAEPGQPGVRPEPTGPVARLTPDLYARLHQLAGERGQTVDALCESVLDGYMRSRLAQPPASGSEPSAS